MRRIAAILGILALGACASNGRSKSADTVAGVSTIDVELGAASDQLAKTVTTLESVIASAGPGLVESYEKYVSELASLDSKVTGLRDRSVAMGVKRDEYLKHWLEQTSKIQNQDLKTQAEARRTQLQTDFQELNGKTSTLKKAYAPLTASLHDCQRFLEADLNPASAKGLSGELEKIKGWQKEVEAAAKDARAALKVIVDKLAIPVPAAPKEEPKK